MSYKDLNKNVTYKEFIKYGELLKIYYNQKQQNLLKKIDEISEEHLRLAAILGSEEDKKNNHFIDWLSTNKENKIKVWGYDPDLHQKHKILDHHKIFFTDNVYIMILKVRVYNGKKPLDKYATGTFTQLGINNQIICFNSNNEVYNGYEKGIYKEIVKEKIVIKEVIKKDNSNQNKKIEKLKSKIMHIVDTSSIHMNLKNKFYKVLK